MMYHSLIINGQNTFDVFGLIPTSRPVINPPEPRYSYIEVPGMSGSLDVSDSLTGRISYENRTGSIEFLVPKDRSWTELYSTLMSFLHGKYMRIVLEDDPLYYYEGRLTLSNWKSNKNNSTITVNYDLAPFKYETTGVDDGYLISDRNLSGSVYYHADETTKVLEMIVNVESMTNPGIRAIIDDISYGLKVGDNILPSLQTDGKGSIRITGNGKITVKYRKGRL